MLITEEAITVLTLLTALYFVRFLVRTVLYVFFTLVRWLCTIALLGLLFCSLF
ncbi:hypothetical protein HMPREF1989_00517 [Porphyromonas gingivalis F0566]|nr:hypothetical protein [Porphyromonas gingivalis]ERJ87846.1 hypothetical protein HMPREF1989_00517 [Porphyromonas gingivalis F0566]